MKYGWKPDLPDHRDIKYGHVPAYKIIPSQVDLRDKCSKVEDQGSLGSCTANAIVGALEYLEYGSDKYEDLSRLFIYYNEREMEGTVKEDSGAMLRDGIKSLVSYGVCSEDDWYYDISKYCVKPSLYCYESAINHRISVYMRLQSLDEMLQCLANNYPFVFGFSVYNVFESEETANTGILSMPRSQDRLLGGHAVLAVGYDKDSKMILVRNSWGSSWGLGGYFWMPFEYLTNRDLSDDFWTIRR